MKINTNNLCIGEEVKNYKLMCKLLGQEIKKGKGRDLQIEDWKRYIDFQRDGHKYIITRIYEQALEKENKRGGYKSYGKSNGGWTNYINLNIPYKKINSIGIYKITLDNKIYIGSTMRGFRKRFQEHNTGNDVLMQHTYDLLQQGGKFEILHDMNGIEDKELVRMVESEFIKEYLLNPEWNVINKKDSSLTFSNYYKDKSRTIKISDKNYFEAIQILVKHGLLDREGFEL